jgi:phosphatidylinositol alpha-1,6-mannosyltransferase
VPSLLVTNDFPPKVGGIQSYLWELWRRLPPDEVTVLTTPYAGAAEFDRAQPFRVVRDRSPWRLPPPLSGGHPPSPGRVLLPTPALAGRIDALAREVGAGLIFLDPALPLGALGPRLRAAPYVAVLHGAEVTIPGRLPGSRAALRRVLDGAAGVLAAGSYPAEEAARAADRPLLGLVIPPGVDVERFRPTDNAATRAATRKRLGVPEAVPLVLGVSRLVPRKGFDVLIDAVARLDRQSFPASAHAASEAAAAPSTGGSGGAVHLALAGSGRDRARLARRAARAGLGGRFHLLGRVPDEDLAAVYGAADVFAMCCRERWGGLEAEGFGIVFLEAAASGLPAVAGRSGGAWEAVEDGTTGFVVDPGDAGEVAGALGRLLADPALRRAMGSAARARAETAFAYDILAARLTPLARGDLSGLTPVGAPPESSGPPSASLRPNPAPPGRTPPPPSP